jgi:hypothetical protein
MNNIVSQALNSQFLDFSFRSFNDVSASLRLLNRRLSITGGFSDEGAQSEFDVIGNQVTRDVQAQYLLKRDGSLILRASNKINSSSFLNPNLENKYVSALGLVYRQEFDNFSELWKIITGKKRIVAPEEPDKEQPVVTTPPIALTPRPSTTRKDSIP